MHNTLRENNPCFFSFFPEDFGRTEKKSRTEACFDKKVQKFTIVQKFMTILQRQTRGDMLQ